MTTFKTIKLFATTCMLLLATVVSAQPSFASYDHDLNYFLPSALQINGEAPLEGRYNSEIPTPKQVLGFEIGERYCDWGDIVRYMEILAKASDRIKLVELGRTYEYRPMIQLIISSPKNLANLDQIKAEHLKLSNPAESASLDTKQMPLVADITCSIHGNEVSGANASLAMAYLFAASEDAPVLEMLDKMVLLIEPGMNPDGIHNFSTWCNHSVGSLRITSRGSYENNEPWPGNRGNHYYANLNRDLLMCQHPEGKVCVSHFLDWLPNLLLDLHEKGGPATFFHSPGHPKRLHPYVTTRNQELTAEVGAYVSKALSPLGAKPYSGKDFDDFYLGKNAAYGDVHGSVCLLFENPNTRNYATTYNGVYVDLPSAIRNQAHASLAALSAGYNMREKLLNHQRDFYQKSAVAAEESPVKGYIFHARGDKARAYRLLENLAIHKVEVYHLAQDVKIGKEMYLAGEAFVIPLASQLHYFKTKALWEKLGLDAYNDKKFYDISTWTLPLAYNVAHDELNSVEGLLGARAELVFPEGSVIGGKSDFAYTFEATGLYSFNLLRALLLEGVGVKIARAPFKVENLKMGYGSAIVEVAGHDSDKVYNILAKAAKENGVDIYAVKKLNIEKLNLAEARMPKVALAVGPGMSGSAVGAIWKLLDNSYGIAPGRLTTISLADPKSLSKYNVLVLANANLPRGHKSRDNVKKWVEEGGCLIVTASAHKTANGSGLTQIKRLPAQESKAVEDVIKGMILNTTIDTTTPLCYGYTHNELPVMKVGTTAYAEPTNDDVIVPSRYTANPYLSGYISQSNLDRFVSTPASFVIKCGKGQVIHFADSPTFRSYWYGANKMFMNAVYFGHLY